MIALLYSQSGVFDVAASKPHTKLTEWLTHSTMIHSVRFRAHDNPAPARFTAPQIVHGFCEYDAHCVMCHGAAAVARQPWVSGMTPQPPYLLDAPRTWNRAELFWIAKHGIKMTGMPAWKDRLSDPQIWDIVAFLEATQKMPPQTYVDWRSKRLCGPAPIR